MAYMSVDLPLQIELVSMAVTQQMLTDAERAYHKLMTGTAVVEFRDSNGETVKYNNANRRELAAYIEQLKRELGMLPRGTGPMTVWF